MSSNTDFVQTINAATTMDSKELKVDAAPGYIVAGPFLPMLSGNYQASIYEVGTVGDLPQKK